MNFFAMSILCAASPYSSLLVKQLPVFTPNDYFFANHTLQNEEKWQTYSRTIRDIMAKESGFKLSERTIEDKFKFKEVLFPKFKNTGKKYSD